MRRFGLTMTAPTTLIYRRLWQLVHACKKLFALIPSNKELIRLSEYFPLRLEANIIVSEQTAYYFMVSQNGGFIKKGTLAISLMTLKASERTWLRILNEHSSLLQEYNRGNVQMSNARANFLYKITLLSLLLGDNSRIIRAGRIIRGFPSAVIRVLLLKMIQIVPSLLNRIPPAVQQSFVNLGIQLSNRLEK